MKTLLLFTLTALAEIVGCYLPWLWLKQGKPAWLLVPAAASLALFAWLLTLHDTAGAGRVYAAYGGVYIGVALAWLWAVDGIRPTAWDVAGVLVALAADEMNTPPESPLAPPPSPAGGGASPARRSGPCAGTLACAAPVSHAAAPGPQFTLISRQSERKFGALVESAIAFAIISTDLDGVIQVFSVGAERMLGYTARPATR
eukprot:gene44123-54831_t